MTRTILRLMGSLCLLSIISLPYTAQARCMTDLYGATTNAFTGQASYYYPATNPKQGCWQFDGYYGYNRCRCPVANEALKECDCLEPKYREACYRYNARKNPCNCLFGG